jgi:hypothetical protein
VLPIVRNFPKVWTLDESLFDYLRAFLFGKIKESFEASLLWTIFSKSYPSIESDTHKEGYATGYSDENKNKGTKHTHTFIVRTSSNNEWGIKP